MGYQDNTACQQCGTKYHYCGSCGLDWGYENTYCSPKCFHDMCYAKHTAALTSVFAHLEDSDIQTLYNYMFEVEHGEHILNWYINQRIEIK